jgi:hypothetical protein
MSKDEKDIAIVDNYYYSKLMEIDSDKSASIFVINLNLLAASKCEFNFPIDSENGKPIQPLGFEGKLAAMARIMRYHDIGSHSRGRLKEIVQDSAVLCARSIFNCFPEKGAELIEREYALLISCSPKSDVLMVELGMEMIRQCFKIENISILGRMKNEKALPYVLRASARHAFEAKQLPRRKDIDVGMSFWRREAAKFRPRFEKNIERAFPGQLGAHTRRAMAP